MAVPGVPVGDVEPAEELRARWRRPRPSSAGARASGTAKSVETLRPPFRHRARAALVHPRREARGAASAAPPAPPRIAPSIVSSARPPAASIAAYQRSMRRRATRPGRPPPRRRRPPGRRGGDAQPARLRAHEVERAVVEELEAARPQPGRSAGGEDAAARRPPARSRPPPASRERTPAPRRSRAGGGSRSSSTCVTTPERPLAADPDVDRVLQAGVAGGVLVRLDAARPRAPTVGEDDPQRPDVAARRTVAIGAGAAGVAGDRAAEGALRLARRIDRIEEPGLAHARLNSAVTIPGSATATRRSRIDLEDPRHPLQREDDAARRDRGAGGAGTQPLRRHGDPARRAEREQLAISSSLCGRTTASGTRERPEASAA